MSEDTIKPAPQKPPQMPHGDFPAPAVPKGAIVSINKPEGLTSAAAISRVKRLLPRKTKVGHAGTLDPFATGVLVVMIGNATKQCEAMMGQPKEYEATIQLGATTETDDLTAPQRPVAGPINGTVPPPREAVEAALQRQVGSILQMPPQFSALKIGGLRACDRIRAGETVTLQPRTVRIDSITLLDYTWPHARIHVACGRGTYIRAIARDLGEALGVGGFLTQLCRTRVGDYSIGNSIAIDAGDEAVRSGLRERGVLIEPRMNADGRG